MHYRDAPEMPPRGDGSRGGPGCGRWVQGPHGHGGAASHSAAWSWVPRGPRQGTGRQARGALGPSRLLPHSPTFLLQMLASREGGPFCKNE